MGDSLKTILVKDILIPNLLSWIRGFFAGKGQLPTEADLQAERDRLIAAIVQQGEDELRSKGAIT